MKRALPTHLVPMRYGWNIDRYVMPYTVPERGWHPDRVDHWLLIEQMIRLQRDLWPSNTSNN